MRATIAFFVACFVVGGAVIGRAQCLGDCDDDGGVTVEEIVGAVDKALGGCATPRPAPTRTPTHHPDYACPFDFTVDTANKWCVYRGSVYDVAIPTGSTSRCAEADPLAWRADGNGRVVVWFEGVYLGGSAQGPYAASLTGWGTAPDATLLPLGGVFSVGGTANRRATIAFNTADLSIDDCSVRYVEADYQYYLLTGFPGLF